jgi:excinuclease ABC subunit B
METAVPGGGAIAYKYKKVAEQAGEYEAVMDPLTAAREIKRLEKEMYALARDLKFEEAARVRDQLRVLQGKSFVA